MNFDYPKNEEEYFNRLTDIEKTLDKSNASEMNLLLDKLYDVKPVKLKWYILKAYTLILLEKDTSEIKELLIKKYQLLFESEKLYDIAVCLSALERENNIENERLLYHISKKECLNKPEYYDFVEKKSNEYDQICKKYLKEGSSDTLIQLMTDNCYIRNDYVSYILCAAFLRKKYNINYGISNWIYEMPNIKQLYNRIMSNKKNTYIVIKEPNNSFNSEVVSRLLAEIGNEVYYISDVVETEIVNVNPEETLNVSLENMKCDNIYHEIYPIKLMKNGNLFFDNTTLLIQFINKELVDDNYSVLLSNGYCADYICQILPKGTERLSMFKAEYFEDNLNFCWSGDYLSYRSEYYGFDVHEKIDSKSECDYSIVIPVRNSIESLRYTLKTCQKIRYKGDFEIVVSDNSDSDNHCINEFIKSIGDSRIKYYRTPKVLPLTLSFEFAYLMAKGKFIFSIGADDGVLPWSLDIIDEVLKKCPNEQILMWERGFYAWPGFNRGQQNQLTIPLYDNGIINVSQIKSEELLNILSNNIQNMYGLPLLYINSGFKREYLKTLLHCTGRILNGINQDISTGIVNLFINKMFVKINFPITIAGMTGNSIGNKMNSHPELDFFNNGKYIDNVNTFPYVQRNIPAIASEVDCVYNGLYKAVSYGIVEKEQIDKLFDIKKDFLANSPAWDKKFDLYDEYFCMYYDLAKKSGFDKEYEEIKKQSYSLIEIAFDKSEKNNGEEIKYDRFYKIGFYGNCLTLDGSDFGIHNILEAEELFEKMISI